MARVGRRGVFSRILDRYLTAVLAWGEPTEGGTGYSRTPTVRSGVLVPFTIYRLDSNAFC
jgi:hypothetical protein